MFRGSPRIRGAPKSLFCSPDMMHAVYPVTMPFDALLGVVEAAGLLLGIENFGHSAEATLYRTVPPGSIYGATLQAITRQPTSEVLERLRLLDLSSISDDVAHEVFAKTLQAGFAAAGNTRGSPGLAPPWAASIASFFGNNGRPAAAHHNSCFADSPQDSLGGGAPTSASTTTESKTSAVSETATPWSSSHNAEPLKGVARNEVDAAIHDLKLAVLGVTRRLMDDVNRLPLQNRTMAVLVDGSRMSMLALELAGAAWKFGRFVVVHVSGERLHSAEANGDDNADGACLSSGPEYEEPSQLGKENHEQRVRGGDEMVGAAGGGGGGRWEPDFLEAELRETCLRQLEIPEESLELVFRSLPPGSSRTVDDVTKVIEATLTEHGVQVVFMGCYGRRGPRVSQFGSVAHWALEHTPYQIVFAKKFSPSMVSPEFFTRPKRYLVAVTSDVYKVSYMLDRLLPLVSPRDSVVLVHIVDESAEDMVAGETVDADEVKSDLQSLLSNKRELSYRVRVEKTGRPPENPTQTVVQRIVKVAEEEAADFLALLYDESRGSYRTVATGCLRETRCGLIAIH